MTSTYDVNLGGKMRMMKMYKWQTLSNHLVLSAKNWSDDDASSSDVNDDADANGHSEWDDNDNHHIDKKIQVRILR